MSVNENGNLRPDGVSVSLPFVGGTYYWNPGSPSAPAVTLTGSLGVGGVGLHSVFLRNGMTSADTLGYGATANIAPTIFPSATVNASIPDENGIPQPWNAKVSSVEAGASLPGFAATYTATPQQITDFVNRHIFGPATGPNDELSPFERTLQSGVGTIGQNNTESPVRFLSSRYQNPLGDGAAGWNSSLADFNPQQQAQPAASPQEPGGLLGLITDYLRNNPN
jgi:hypothetical protein